MTKHTTYKILFLILGSSIIDKLCTLDLNPNINPIMAGRIKQIVSEAKVFAPLP
mgnify:CR=1 FL=1